jgi:hypothetical protein
MKKVWVDPPSGWRYGFPKIYDRLEDGEDMHAWMVAQGYPQAEIDRMGDYFFVRCWSADEEQEGAFEPGLPIKGDR